MSKSREVAFWLCMGLTLFDVLAYFFCVGNGPLDHVAPTFLWSAALCGVGAFFNSKEPSKG